jgi:hypothetical protein
LLSPELSDFMEADMTAIKESRLLLNTVSKLHAVKESWSKLSIELVFQDLRLRCRLSDSPSYIRLTVIGNIVGHENGRRD